LAIVTNSLADESETGYMGCRGTGPFDLVNMCVAWEIRLCIYTNLTKAHCLQITT